MPIDRLDFDNLGENDLNELIAAQVPEGLQIDYKRDLYGNSDEDKRELLKDVSGFANAFGGHLIIGIEEQNGLPIAKPGISNIDQDAEKCRLEQIVRSGIEPRIQGIRIGAVPLADGAYCFVLRIPRSWSPPHRVSAKNCNRFWIRNSGSTHEASVEELRTLFTLGADALHRVHQFRDERLHEIISGNSARPLQGDGRLILHIVPLAAVTSPWQVDLAKVFQLREVFRPMDVDGGTASRYNFEGIIIERSVERSSVERNYGYTQVFRNGALEATKAGIILTGKIYINRKEQKYIPRIKLEKDILKVLPGYVNGLRDVGLPPPLIVLFTFEGVKGIPYIVSPNFNDLENVPEPVIEHDILRLPECLINEYGSVQDYQRAVKPAFDVLWNIAGRNSAQSFSADGSWIGEKKK